MSYSGNHPAMQMHRPPSFLRTPLGPAAPIARSANIRRLPNATASPRLGANGALASAMGLFAAGPSAARAPHPFPAGRFQKIS
jgi:hypothetical protein